MAGPNHAVARRDHDRRLRDADEARMKPLSDMQRRCVIEATIEPLTPFRRGYARSKTGPFYDVRTVHSLIQTGALRMIMIRTGRKFGTVTARAAA
jgi:hypothetical protein